ncbi:MAG: glycosyltransferase [Symploca sp. SIO2D2]|nr:glycosyltransferase [Symploca sp. SIO2D2]
MQAPLASILINNYNNGRFLRSCIDSALNQTYENTEVVIYDDESHDESIEILKSYAPECKVIYGKAPTRRHPHNQVNAVNQAFAQCKGDYIFLLDGDDQFLPHKLETLIKAFIEHDSDFIQTPTYTIDQNGKRRGVIKRSRIHVDNLRQAVCEDGFAAHTYMTCSLAFSRRMLDEVMPVEFPDRTFFRIDSYLGTVAIAGYKSLTLDEPLSLKTVHGSNRSLFWKNPFNTVQGHAEKTKLFNRYSPQRISAARTRIALLRYFASTVLNRFLVKLKIKKPKSQD